MEAEARLLDPPLITRSEGTLIFDKIKPGPKVVPSVQREMLDSRAGSTSVGLRRWHRKGRGGLLRSDAGPGPGRVGQHGRQRPAVAAALPRPARARPALGGHLVGMHAPSPTCPCSASPSCGQSLPSGICLTTVAAPGKPACQGLCGARSDSSPASVASWRWLGAPGGPRQRVLAA